MIFKQQFFYHFYDNFLFIALIFMSLSNFIFLYILVVQQVVSTKCCSNNTPR